MSLPAPPPLDPARLAALDAAAEAALPLDDPLAASSALRAAGHGADATAWALSQRSFRAGARTKLGDRAERMLFTRAGLEQASRAELAARHAATLRAAGASAVVDAGCGLGADSLAFLDAGLDVLAVEIDEETASLTAWNLARHPRGERARVVVADVLELLESGTLAADGEWGGFALWFDPARREAGASGRRRTFDPEAFSPPLSALTALSAAEPGRVLAAKLGPGLESASVPGQFDIEWITHRQDTVEAVISTPPGHPGRPSARAVRLEPDACLERPREPLAAPEGSPEAHDDGAAPDLAPEIRPGDTLWEPVGSVLRAGFVRVLAAELDADQLDPEIAYVLSARESQSAPAAHPLAAGYRVLETLPLHTKKLKAWVRAEGITELTVKKRGVDLDPAAVRRQLLAGSKPSGKARKAATLVLTRHAGKRVAVAVEPL